MPRQIAAGTPPRQNMMRDHAYPIGLVHGRTRVYSCTRPYEGVLEYPCVLMEHGHGSVLHKTYLDLEPPPMWGSGSPYFRIRHTERKCYFIKHARSMAAQSMLEPWSMLKLL